MNTEQRALEILAIELGVDPAYFGDDPVPLDITLRAIIRALSPPASAAVVPRVSQSAITLAVLRAYDALTPMEGERLDFYLARVRQHATEQLATPTPPATAQEVECEVVGACYSTRTLTVRLPVMPRSINVRSRATIMLTSPDSGKEG